MSEKTNAGGNASPPANRKVVAILVAALFIAIAAVGYVSATSSSIENEALPIVETGDTVYVDYVGKFVDNPGGWVFDTNKLSVGTDKNIVKSLYFTERTREEYTPLNFTAGLSENYLQPFVKGVVGMSVYQTKKILIPIEEAYSLVEENIEVMPLVMDVPIIQNITYSEFQSEYSANPYIGLQFAQRFWGWETMVIDVQNEKVFLQNQPTIGEIISSFGNPENDPRDGWYQKVIDVNASAENGVGVIKVENLLKSQDAYQKKGLNYNGSSFTVLEVNETQGWFTIIYNTSTYIGELAGRALLFELTVTAVRKY